MSNYYLCNTATLDVKLTPSAYRVYHLLSSMADNKTRQSFPSKAYMAELLGVCKKTIQRATQCLVKAGLLEITSSFRPSSRMQSTNRYTLLDEPQTSLEQPVDPSLPKGKLHRISRETMSTSLSGGALRTYCFLKSHTGKNGLCYTYLFQIARRLQKSKRTVQRYLQELTCKGLLSIERINGNKNVYRVQKAPKHAPAARNYAYRRPQEKCAVLEATKADIRKQEQFFFQKLRASIAKILALRI